MSYWPFSKPYSTVERSLLEFRSERRDAPAEAGQTQVALTALLTGIAYYIGSKLGFALTFAPDPISVLWAPNSLLMAALILSPMRSWWMILLAVFPAHLLSQLQSSIPIPMIVAWFVSNCSEALLGAVGIRWFAGGALRFDSVRMVSIFVISAGCVAPLLSSLLDAAFVQMNQFGEKPYWDLVWMRFFSNSVAALTIVPATVILVTAQTGSLFRAGLLRYFEYGILFSGLIIANFLVFYNREFALNAGPIFFYLQLPFLFWALFRFGPAGVSAAIVALVVMAILGASSGGGPFVNGSPEQSARSIQEFLIVVIVLLMMLTAIVMEREQSQEYLRESKRLNELVFEAAGMGVWGWNPTSGKIWATRECRSLFGWGPEDAISGDALIERIHPQERQTLRHALDRVLLEGGKLDLETRIVLPGGNMRWVVLGGRAIHESHDRPRHMLGVCVDVTARKTSELAAKQHLNEIAHMTRVSTMGQLGASLAHELNQPITAILSNAQAAQRFMAAQPPNIGEVHEILKDIVSDNRRAGEIIRGMHVLVKKGQPEFTSVDLGAVMTDMAKLVRGDAILRNVRVAVQCNPRVPRVRCDPIQLQQVTLNLLVNAFDAMAEVPISEREVTMRVDANGADTVRVTISDRGTGLTPDMLSHMFNPFFTTKTKGLGMGLAISLSIVEAHGGHLWAENNTERGAAFYFTLPVIAAGSSAAPS